MYVIHRISFILIVIHTGLLWSVQTSPELSDNNNVASEAKVELIFFALAASCNSFIFISVLYLGQLCYIHSFLFLSPQFVYHSI